jgi:Domain of unknown function (DUF5666)
MRRTPIFKILVFKILVIFEILVIFGSVLLARSATAQDDGQGDQAAEIVQLFGQGNGIRGLVTGAVAGSFLIRTGEGENYKVFYSPNTRMMKDRQPVDAKEIHPGDELIAAGQLDRKAKTLGAVFLYDMDAGEVQKARAGFGKTWTAGKITSIHGLKLTIEAVDSKQPQIVSVDENTSFRRQNESITLGDIKVGDFISVRGVLRDKTFLAGVLRVMDAAAGNNLGLLEGAVHAR